MNISKMLPEAVQPHWQRFDQWLKSLSTEWRSAIYAAPISLLTTLLGWIISNTLVIGIILGFAAAVGLWWWHTHNKPIPTKSFPIDGLTRLPETRAKLFGREDELAIINQAWANPKTHILVLEAFGGMGKTALLQTWLSQFINTKRLNVRTETAYIWSFYSQGTAEDRQASAEPFLLDALKWFGHTGDLPTSAHERGIALAKLIAAKRSLLVLDGVEPLQHPTGKVGGGLRDPGLKAMLRQLSMHNPGLVLISSRQPIVEIEDQAPVIHHPLEPLDDTAAAALFSAAKLSGTPAEFAEANQALQGHALSLNLLANYLATYTDGDIRKRDQLPTLLKFPEQNPLAEHAFRVIQAHANQLQGTAELAILYMIGLFDRPVSQAVVEHLYQSDNPILALIAKLDNRLLQATLNRLREQGLLCSVTHPAEPSHSHYPLDAHPLIRHYFAQQFKTEHPQDWQAAHQSLYAYHKELPKKHQPDTLEEMQPLFAAVMHGCAAGLHQQALMEVYYPRIQREDEGYLIYKLGAFGLHLAVIAHFFSKPWNEPVIQLSEEAKAAMLNWAAFGLRALGRLNEATQPFQIGMEIQIAQQDWRNSANAASNLSMLHLILGSVTKAVDIAQRGVKFSNQSKNQSEQMGARIAWAETLTKKGNYATAGTLFAEAEQIQHNSEPKYPQLYSVQGFQYCAWWLCR